MCVLSGLSAFFTALDVLKKKKEIPLQAMLERLWPHAFA